MLVDRFIHLRRAHFIGIFLVVAMLAGTLLSILAWHIALEIPWQTVTVVAVPVTIAVALPILIFIARIIDRLTATERKLRQALAEQSAAQSKLKRHTDLEARLGRLMTASSDEIYFFEAETLRFLYVNDGARQNLGFTQEELSSLTPIDLKPDISPTEFRNLIAPLVLGAETMLVFETRHLRKNDTSYPVEVHLQYAPAESPPLFIATIQDITQRERSLQDLEQAREKAEEANRAKSAFLANMSHELRTPLDAILGFSEMIGGQYLGPIADKRYIEYGQDIERSGQHLLEIINDILDISKIEAGSYTLNEEVASLGDTVRRCFELLEQQASKGGIKLISDENISDLHLQCDRLRLKQILINVLSNAVKFTAAGGEVRISSQYQKDGTLDIVVCDNGSGMNEKEVEVALSMFGQVDQSLARKFEGTGLGLPLSKSLMELHGGTLDVESEKGAGTSVHLRFPQSRLISSAAA
jgi:PAS domain S-box-containing protein